MYRMLIADDEQIVLDGLTKSINWQEYNVEVVATALNGTDALELAKNTMPDIVITDIKMPGLNGLELIKQLRQFLPDAVVIIISAYEQFEFAKEAIKYGVFSYITKMIKKQAIIDTIENAVKLLEKRNSESLINQRLEKRFNESLPILREYFLNMLISGINSENACNADTLRLYGLQISTGSFVCMVIMPEQGGGLSDATSEHSIQMKNIGIADITKEQLEKSYRCEVFTSFKGEIVAIVNTQDNEKEKLSVRSTTQAATEIKQRIFDELGCSASIGISNAYSELSNMQEAYADAQRALQYRLVYGENTVINIKNVDVINANEHIVSTNINSQLDQMKNMLYTGRYCDVKSLSEQITSKFKNQHCISYNYVQQIYIQMLSVVIRTIIEFKIDQSTLCPEYENIYGALLQKQSFNEIDSWFDTILRNACDEISRKNDAKTQNTIQKAIDYMRQNVEKNISLSDVAEHIYFNPSYFSRYFKESIGMSFVEYMKQLKIERAKELLAGSNYKIYEICDLLGYQSVQYFSTLFKTTVGLTPQEYKENHRS